VSEAACQEPVGNYEETPYLYPNYTIPLITQRRGCSVSFVLEDAPSKSLKRHAETRALLSGCLSHSEGGLRCSRLDVEPEGGKRHQKIKQRREKVQISDFWNPTLDPDAPGEQAVPDGKGSRPVTECLPAEYGAGKIIATRAVDDLQRLRFNPILPFQMAYQYKLVKFFHESKSSLVIINQFFKAGLLLDAHRVHFQSGYTWRNKMREMIDQPGWMKGTVDFHLHKGYIFYYRDLEDTIQYLLQQHAYAEHLVFAAIHEFNEQYKRVCTDMHTGDWWWRTQVGNLSCEGKSMC